MFPLAEMGEQFQSVLFGIIMRVIIIWGYYYATWPYYEGSTY